MEVGTLGIFECFIFYQDNYLKTLIRYAITQGVLALFLSRLVLPTVYALRSSEPYERSFIWRQLFLSSNTIHPSQNRNTFYPPYNRCSRVARSPQLLYQLLSTLSRHTRKQTTRGLRVEENGVGRRVRQVRKLIVGVADGFRAAHILNLQGRGDARAYAGCGPREERYGRGDQLCSKPLGIGGEAARLCAVVILQLWDQRGVNQ